MFMIIFSPLFPFFCPSFVQRIILKNTFPFGLFIMKRRKTFVLDPRTQWRTVKPWRLRDLGVSCRHTWSLGGWTHRVDGVWRRWVATERLETETTKSCMYVTENRLTLGGLWLSLENTLRPFRILPSDRRIHTGQSVHRDYEWTSRGRGVTVPTRTTTTRPTLLMDRPMFLFRWFSDESQRRKHKEDLGEGVKEFFELYFDGIVDC